MENSEKVIRTIDVTPTWESILPILLMTIENGTSRGRKVAIEELTRMAQIADKYVALSKEEEPE
jgi:tryptophanase